MALALFDLDNTLLSTDSDHCWGEFIIQEGLVNGDYYRNMNDGFYRDYLAGTLDIVAYQSFCLGEMAKFDPRQLEGLLERFLLEVIEPMITEQALALVEQHRQAGDTLVIITATNEIITRPIADHFNIEHLIATEAEYKDDKLTGNIKGVPSYARGKIKRLKQWMKTRPELTLAGSHFYSDSHNDIPLLEVVEFPFAVDADEKLTAHAKQKNWPKISLR